MKASPALIERVSHLLADRDIDEDVLVYSRGLFKNADKVKDINTRFRHDMFYACARKDPALYDAVNAEGLADTHIATMMGAVLPRIELSE